MNAFTLKIGVPEFLSLLTLVEGVHLDFNKHFHVIFGEDAQIFEDNDYAMKEEAIRTIALGLSSI